MKHTLKTKKEQENMREEAAQFYKAIPSIVERLASSCRAPESFDHVDPTPFPSQEMVVRIILQARCVLFPGYFTHSRVDEVNLIYSLGQECTQLFERLSTQIVLAFQHACLQYGQACNQCVEQGHKAALRFLEALPHLRTVLATDTRAALQGDPAAKSFDEIIFSYPGLFAITVYRMAHCLYDLGIPLLPRMMTEYAHSLTGIDIHPGARIGERFFIDHGTGIVVGETAVLGRGVSLYQGVTLGAKKFELDARGNPVKGVPRHPILEDDVIVYAGATILGRVTIGRGSVIGGNVWLTESVPPGSKITHSSEKI